MSNYPPGVTGNEYEIAGADYEVERTLTCTACGVEDEQLVEGYRGREWFTCEHCDHMNELEPEEEQE